MWWVSLEIVLAIIQSQKSSLDGEALGSKSRQTFVCFKLDRMPPMAPGSLCYITIDPLPPRIRPPCQLSDDRQTAVGATAFIFTPPFFCCRGKMAFLNSFLHKYTMHTHLVVLAALLATVVAQQSATPNFFVCDCPGKEAADPVCGSDSQVCITV